MVNNQLKTELNKLKQQIAEQTLASFTLSYNDVIAHLVKLYNSNQNKVIASPLQKSGLYVSIPLKKVVTQYVTDLNQKDWIVK